MYCWLFRYRASLFRRSCCFGAEEHILSSVRNGALSFLKWIISARVAGMLEARGFLEDISAAVWSRTDSVTRKSYDSQPAFLLPPLPKAF
ncbi:hypothetical protein BH23GEM6_BH23GEM6_14560 [soil metagenome]